ncbi:MAG: hypothetical protein JSV74_01485 [Dehalococcoidia bacterium]|nr:MAG: hypothetical protein JSV74_01485 [Dehalococcoidia bacterium]
MAARFKKGQRVTIIPTKSQSTSPRDADLESYIGHSGKIVDYYWIRPGKEIFFIYTVQIEDGEKEIVVHEDEIEAHLA